MLHELLCGNAFVICVGTLAPSHTQLSMMLGSIYGNVFVQVALGFALAALSIAHKWRHERGVMR